MIGILKSILYEVVRLISLFQNRLSAKHTAYYISIESLFFGILSTFILTIIFKLSVVDIVTSMSTFILYSIIVYIILYSRSKPNSPSIVELNKYAIIIIFSISQLPVLFSYQITESSILIPISGIILVYTVILINRNRKYLKEPEFFVNDYSKVYDYWVEGSVCLENAIDNMQKNNNIRTYYWGLRSEWTYNIITNNESMQFQVIASELSTASNIISASAISNNKNDKNIYINEAYRALSEALDSSYDQICDNCGRQLRAGSIYGYEKKDNICSNCNKISDYGSLNVDEKNVSDAKRDKNRYEDKYNNKKREKKKFNNRRKREKRKYRSSNSKNSDDKDNLNASTKNSLEILGLDKDVNVRQLKKSYRKKVKKAHPDSGGSAEKFKEVNEAYNTVRNYIEEE